MKYLQPNIKLLLIVLFSAWTTISFSQQVYRTVNGLIAITIKNNDSTLVVSSHQLQVLLNYETGEISFRVPYETFFTRIDSINNKLKLLSGQWLEYTGKLAIPYINTKGHPPQKFDTEGIITSTTPPAFVMGKGTLDHISSNGTISCVLSLTTKFSLSTLNLRKVFQGADDLIQINIQQAVLKRVND